MAAQLSEAMRLGTDVLWWTDHDWRMRAVQYWDEVAFEQPRVERMGIGWQWQRAGNPDAIGRHEFRTPTSTPERGSTTTALYVSQELDNKSVTEYSLKVVADRDTYRTSLSGQQIDIDIYPEQLSGAGYLAFDLVTSFRPAIGGREAGTYRLSYRVGGEGKPGSSVARGRLGVITQEAPVGQWSTWTVDPAADLSAIWPEIDGRDACSFDFVFSVQAAPTGASSGYFGGLRIQRSGIEGDEPLATQRELMEHYREEFSSVTQLLGLEVSLANPHLGAYGGDLAIPIDPGDKLQGVLPPAEVGELVSRLQGQGSLVSYNHPFGTSNEAAAPPQQGPRVQQVATELVREQVYGAQMLEVGYRARGGVDLGGHLQVWDACSRAGIFTTGIGVNDNHSGMGWDTAENNFTTWIWAQEATSAALSAALVQGRAYFGDPTLFEGSIDLATSSGTRMGQVEESEDHGSELTITVSARPQGSSVVLLSLDIPDGSDTPPQGAPGEADYSRITVAEADFSDDLALVQIDPAAQRMYRVEVLDQSQAIIACSNPIWLLAPSTGATVPQERYP